MPSFAARILARVSGEGECPAQFDGRSSFAHRREQNVRRSTCDGLTMNLPAHFGQTFSVQIAAGGTGSPYANVQLVNVKPPGEAPSELL